MVQRKSSAMASTKALAFPLASSANARCINCLFSAALIRIPCAEETPLYYALKRILPNHAGGQRLFTAAPERQEVEMSAYWIGEHEITDRRKFEEYLRKVVPM